MKLKQLEPVQVVVDGVRYHITPFPAFKAANLTGELSSVLAPILGAIAPLVKDNGDIGDIDTQDAAMAMSNLNIDGNKLEKLMQKLLLGGHIVIEVENEDGEAEGERLDMDMVNEIFCGEILSMFMLCFEVIKINFGGFFKKLGNQSGVAELVKKKRQIL